VLDDILDGGQTMAAIRDHLLNWARSFHCAVMVEKSRRRKAYRRRLRRPEDPGPLRAQLGTDAGNVAQPAGDPRHARQLMLAILGGSGLTQLATSRRRDGFPRVRLR
jgi:hypothetical protein